MLQLPLEPIVDHTDNPHLAVRLHELGVPANGHQHFLLMSAHHGLQLATKLEVSPLHHRRYHQLLGSRPVQYQFAETLLQLVTLHPLKQDYQVFQGFLVRFSGCCCLLYSIEGQEEGQIQVFFSEGCHFEEGTFGGSS